MSAQSSPLPDPLAGYNRAMLNILDDFAQEKAQQADLYKAVLNVLQDFSTDKQHAAHTQRAILNILDDFTRERERLGDMHSAVLNILEDFIAEKERLSMTQRAVLSILEDFVHEKERLADMHRAVVNILDDLDEENRKVEARSRELVRSNTELEQFAYVASHDLQEPLRMISSYTQLLEQRFGDKLDEKGKKYIYYAVDGAQRLHTLINDLLAFSRVSSRALPLVRTAARSALDAALLNLSEALRQTEGKVTSGELPMVMADRSQLVQLFQNLIGNGIKFRGSEPPRVHVSAEPDDGGWVFCVRDNGIGIEPRHFDRIFVIFQRLHSRDEYPGTGIGLAVCRRIVERHGGRLWVESEPGKGSAFFFTLAKA